MNLRIAMEGSRRRVVGGMGDVIVPNVLIKLSEISFRHASVALLSLETTAMANVCMPVVDGRVREGLWRRRCDLVERRGSRPIGHEVHPSWAIAATCRRRSEPPGRMPGARLPPGQGNDGSAQELPDDLVARPRLRQRGDANVAAVAGERAGEGPLAGGADDRFAEGAAAVAGAVTTGWGDRGCLDDAVGERHRLPYPAS